MKIPKNAVIRGKRFLKFASSNAREVVNMQNIAEVQAMPERFGKAILLDVNNGAAPE